MNETSYVIANMNELFENGARPSRKERKAKF